MSRKTNPHFDPASDREFEFDVTLGLTHPQMAVRWGGREVLPGQVPTIEHRNYGYAVIKYTVRGEGIYRYDGHAVRIEPGMVFWSKAMAWSRLEPLGTAPLVNYAVMLYGREVNKNLEKFLHAEMGATRLSNPDDVEDVMRDIMVEGLSNSDYRGENSERLVEVLLRRIDCNMTSTVKPKKLARKTYWQCKRFIERRCDEITELGEVADACDVTVPYICRLFDQFDTMRPYEYLSALKLSKAERLLTRSNQAVKDVAAAVGYKDLQLFSRNFKLRYGKSPTKYRKAHT